MGLLNFAEKVYRIYKQTSTTILINMKGNQWPQIKVFELLHGHGPTDKALGNYMKSSHKRSGRPLNIATQTIQKGKQNVRSLHLKFPRQNKTITARRNALGHDQRLQKAYDQKTYGPSCLPSLLTRRRIREKV